MAVDLDTLRAMKSAGISFIANARTPWGGQDIVLGTDDVAEFVADQASVAARHFELTKVEYLEWLASDGTVQCSATTVAGSRCKNPVSGSFDASPQEWKQRHGQYCAVHGGPGGSEK